MKRDAKLFLHIMIGTVLIAIGSLMMYGCTHTDNTPQPVEAEIIPEPEIIEVIPDPEPEPEIIEEPEPLKLLYFCHACLRDMETTHTVDVDGEHFTDICDECLAFFKSMIPEATLD